MKFHDRLYGRIELPPLAHQLAESCPVLLRLREVRMANIPFASYPSFANVSRFEHSLGVAHLAWRFGREQQLPEDEAIALTIAALYHDGASPAFGHLYEEFLIPGGFDHERALVELLTGRAELDGGADAQIFLGRRCRLPSQLPAFDQDSILSCHGVSTILAGTHRLSQAIVGSLDLDNIDNVIRAATAMGILGENAVHPYEILAELAIEDGELRRMAGERSAISRWQEARRCLYAAILGNSFEFRAQSAIKWAIAEAAEDEPDLAQPTSWTLTEPELVFGHLQEHEAARRLVDSVRLGSPPEQLLIASVEDISPLLRPESAERVREFCAAGGELIRSSIFLNFYKDKAERAITLPIAEQPAMLAGAPGSVANPAEGGRAPGVIGLFKGWGGEGEYERARHGPPRPSRDDWAKLLAERLSLEFTSTPERSRPVAGEQQFSIPA